MRVNLLTMGVLEFGPQAIGWWISGLRDLTDVLYGVWPEVVLLVLAFGTLKVVPPGTYTLPRRIRTRRVNQVVSRATRWFSRIPGWYFVRLALVGLLLVPAILISLDILGVLFLSLVIPESAATILILFFELIALGTCYVWLFRYLRSGFLNPPPLPTHEEFVDSPPAPQFPDGTSQ